MLVRTELGIGSPAGPGARFKPTTAVFARSNLNALGYGLPELQPKRVEKSAGPNTPPRCLRRPVPDYRRICSVLPSPIAPDRCNVGGRPQRAASRRWRMAQASPMTKSTRSPFASSQPPQVNGPYLNEVERALWGVRLACENAEFLSLQRAAWHLRAVGAYPHDSRRTWRLH
jgi:hypothetical protein